MVLFPTMTNVFSSCWMIIPSCSITRFMCETSLFSLGLVPLVYFKSKALSLVWWFLTLIIWDAGHLTILHEWKKMMTNLPPLLLADIYQLENSTLWEHPELGNTATVLIVYRLRRGLLQEIILNSSSVGLLRRSIFSAVVSVEWWRNIYGHRV